MPTKEKKATQARNAKRETTSAAASSRQHSDGDDDETYSSSPNVRERSISPTNSDISHFRPNWDEGGVAVVQPSRETRTSVAEDNEQLQREIASLTQLLISRINSVAGRQLSSSDIATAVKPHGSGGAVPVASTSLPPMQQTMDRPDHHHSPHSEDSLKRRALQNRTVVPRFAGSVPPQTLEAIASRSVGLPDPHRRHRTLGPLLNTPSSPTAAMRSSPVVEEETLAPTMHSVTQTRGPLLRPAERALRDAQWAASTLTRHGEDLPDALRAKEVELANALKEWRAVERDYSTHQRAANELLRAKRELEAINANHQLDMTRVRHETKAVQARLNAQEKQIRDLHDAIREQTLRLQLATVRRPRLDEAQLRELEQLNSELAALKFVRDKEEKHFAMEIEARAKRAETLKRTIDTFDANSYVQSVLAEQHERLRVQKESERAAAAAAAATSSDHEQPLHTPVALGEDADQSGPSMQRTSQPSKSPARPSSTTSRLSQVSTLKRVVAPEVIDENRSRLESFLSGSGGTTSGTLPPSSPKVVRK